MRKWTGKWKVKVTDWKWGRTSSYTVGSSFADEVVEENGRTYHVFKDGSEFFLNVLRVELIKGQSICFRTMRFEFCHGIGLEALLT